MNRLLNGRRVLVTRPAQQAENLCRLIEDQGGVAVRFPSLSIAAVDDPFAVRRALAQVDSYQWLIFISANAVTMHSYYSDGVKIEQFKSTRIAAIGKATAHALAVAGMAVDLVPSNGYDSEALLAMPAMQAMAGQRCLIIRGEGGRDELATVLRKRGATVDYVDVYKRVIPNIDGTEVRLLLAQGKLAVITITSGEALQNLMVMLGGQCHQQMFQTPLVVVSGRIRQIAADLGFKRVAVADNPSDSAILETVTMCVTGGIEWPN
ncbi:MAG: uroporphyrinogen-III synthase [Methylococcales bacterium]|nr:uroporphyrinogen-III synthase [Methylococcales bacterium]